MGAVMSAVAQLVQLGLVIEPQIMDAVNTEMQLSGTGQPTPEQQAALDAALDAAHAALQAAQPAPQPGAGPQTGA